MSSFWRNRLARPSRGTILLLIGGAIFLLCLWAFFELAEDYPKGAYRKFDEAILLALRTTADPAVPRGPLWLKDMMRDVSALGSAAVLGVGVMAILGYLACQRRWQSVLLVTFASAGGTLLERVPKTGPG